MDKKEIIIHYKTSSHLFKNNQTTDFKTVLPHQNYIQSYSNICIKNILCEFTKDNVPHQSTPAILKTGHSNILDFFNRESISSSANQNVYNSLLGSYHVQYNSIGNIKSTYLLMKKTLIRKLQFYSLINKTLGFMSIPYKINTSKSTRIQIIPNGTSNENIFVSQHFLVLCGFTQQQMDLIGGYSIKPNEKYFNLENFAGVIANGPYCQNLKPPINLGIESTGLGCGLHNFTGDTSRLLCSVQNHDGEYSITRQFKNPVWFDVSKIPGGVLHVRICSNDHTQKELKSKITKLIIHIELQIMTTKEKRELIFAKLLLSNDHPSPNQSFWGRLSHPIKLDAGDTISLKSVKTGGFMNILPEDQNIEIVKIVEGIEEKINVKINQSTFKSYQDFIKCMNICFNGYKIKFSQRKKHLTLTNEDNQNIIVKPSPIINQMWGHDGDSIKLIPKRIHTFSHTINLCAGTPKILSVRTSLGSNNGFVDLVNDHQNIVFLCDGENPASIDFKDKYHHKPGLFSYVRLTFTSMLEKKFKVNDKHVYITFVIENYE